MQEGFAFAGAKAYMATEINHVSDVINDLVAGYNIESKCRKFSAVHAFSPVSPCRIAV